MTGATPKGVGPSQAEPVLVSSLRASVPSAEAQEFSRFGDNPIMLEAAAALGRSHAERGFEPYWQAIFSKRQDAYIRAYNQRKAELANGKRLTAEDIDAARSPKGGWTRETLAGWGVPWPPPRGWKTALITGTEGRER